MKNKWVRIIPVIIAAVVFAAVIASAAALIVLQIRSSAIHDDYQRLLTDEKVQKPVSAEGVEVITQDVSCGYAVIEMFALWCGKEITEESLYEEYGKVITSTGGKFCKEMNKRFPEYTTSIHKYLKNTELIELVYGSLAEGIPVPFEWAALYGEDWTLHYSLIIGMDVPNNTVRIANPYGYYEEITIDELLDRTSFNAYEKMPLFFRLAFAFGVFEKNTVFLVQ